MKKRTSTKKNIEVIKKDMLLGEVVGKYPETLEVFMKHGLPCATCGAALYETVEQGAETHGIDLKALLKDLNKVAKK